MPSKRNNNVEGAARPTVKSEDEKGTWTSLILNVPAFAWSIAGRNSVATNVSIDDECIGRCAGCGGIGAMNSKCSDCNNFRFKAIPNGEVTSQGVSEDSRIAGWWRLVSRSTVGGEALPKVGQACLIIKGEEKQGFGHMGVVLRLTDKRVVVGYRDYKTGKPLERLKTPGALVLLETGLEAHNDEHGRLWVVRNKDDRT